MHYLSYSFCPLIYSVFCRSANITFVFLWQSVAEYILSFSTPGILHFGATLLL